MHRIYLDYNASSPLSPQVLTRLIKELQEDLGNASSIHYHGQLCRNKLEASRKIIANFFRVKPQEIIFTSGGTEGAALLIRGIALKNPQGHILSSVSEHACVLQTLKTLESNGHPITLLETGLYGAVDPTSVEAAIRPETSLITLMAVNNETGVLTDIKAIASIAERYDIPFVVDGVAWLGKEKIEIPSGVSALFFSGHKFYAPKGVGFCICRTSVKLEPLFIGGGQELNRRGGTENLPSIIAMSEAIKLIQSDQETQFEYLRSLRDLLEKGLQSELKDIQINGLGPRVSNTTNIAFMGIDGESLLMNLDLEGVSASHGSACSSGSLEPSLTLRSMGIPLAQVNSSIRFSIGRGITKEEIERATKIILDVVKRLQSFKK